MGLGNGVDFRSTIPNKRGWTEEGFVDEGGEVVLKAMSQDGFLNRGQHQTFQSKCPWSNRGDLHLPLFVSLNKGDGGAGARPPDPENQKSRLPARIHQNRGTMPQGKPEFRGNRLGSRRIEVAEAFAPMNFPGRVRQAALIG